MNPKVEELFRKRDTEGDKILQETRVWLQAPERKDLHLLQEAFKLAPTNQVYAIREGAPYAISKPGCIGFVNGYTESGLVILVVVALAKGQDPTHKGRPIPLPFSVQVDSKWLWALTREDAEKLS